MRIFLAGIIQGSHRGGEVHDQGYRERLKALLRQHFPTAELLCPVELHPTAGDYDLDGQRLAFLSLVHTASQADVIVAYLPEASLGTAIELWEGYHHGRAVVVITPMRENWVINLLADVVVPSLEAFEQLVVDGRLAALAAASANGRGPRPRPGVVLAAHEHGP